MDNSLTYLGVQFMAFVHHTITLLGTHPGALAQEVATFTLISTALVLGMRHGVDWDHIAAITDIASTTTTEDVTEVDQAGTNRAAPAPKLWHLELKPMWLSFLYALGHALVVAVLGSIAILFAGILPDWIDPIMERLVGVTLVILGIWVLFSLAQYLRGNQADFRIQSRWMLLFALVRHGSNRVRALFGDHRQHTHPHVEQYGPRTAFGVGMIHGIGAETGSQALLIAAVGGATGQGIGVGMLLAFTVGLVISNTIIAVLAATGFITSARARPLYIVIAVLTAIFSLFVGIYFVFGIGDRLPELGQYLTFLGTEAGE